MVPEVAQAVLEIGHQTTVFSDPSCLHVRVLSAEKRYSNIEREALGILHGLKKFHHYCFARDVRIITDHKPLVAIFRNDDNNNMTQTTMNPPQNAPIQSQKDIKTWSRSLHSTVALQRKTQRKQRWKKQLV